MPTPFQPSDLVIARACRVAFQIASDDEAFVELRASLERVGLNATNWVNYANTVEFFEREATWSKF